MNKPSGARLFYAVAFVATLVSIDTSWRFFAERLHISNVYERAGMFAVIELALVACGRSMAGGVARDGRPGPARILVWALCGAAGYMAFDLAGPTEGLARVALGPVLAVVCLHLALGIEIRSRHTTSAGTWARIGRELRERMLSRLGLANDERDALARTRDRAAERAARLATAPGFVFRRRARLAKAVRTAGVAVDEAMKARMLAHVAAYGNLAALVALDLDSPWTSVPVPVPSIPVPSPRPSRPRNAPTSGGPAVQWDVDKAVRLILDGAPSDEVSALSGASAKDVQRTRRIVKGIQDGLADEALSTGGVTPTRVQHVRRAMAVTA